MWCLGLKIKLSCGMNSSSNKINSACNEVATRVFYRTMKN